jgi:BirA family biotin operon repressor/biotin-[acetyl-CoA-carboxylase] ligase
VLASVDSTMAEAARRAPHQAGPAWILARSQTAARGRRGRAWAMPAGNFAATLVLFPPGGPAEAALRSFTAALALDAALCELTGRPELFALKWPNDVLLQGGKLAGILLETLPRGGLAVGIGVNLAAAPVPADLEPQALRPVALAPATGLVLTPEDLMTPLAAAFARLEKRLRTEGFAPVRAAWLARAARLGQQVTARTGTETHTGTFETIDPQGHLILATPRGRRAIPAAEIFF